MKKPDGNIRAGEIYRAPAPRVRGGFRYVKVKQIRQIHSYDPYALLQEVDPRGRPRHGRDRSGFDKGALFVSVLTKDAGGLWKLNGGYEKA